MAKQLKEIKIDELIQDDNNANKGTVLGQALIEASIENLGLGRSIVVDKNNRIIAGNKTQNPKLLQSVISSALILTATI